MQLNSQHVQKVFELLCVYGVAHRELLKNYLPLIKMLKKRNLVRKVHVRKKVYYELTVNALPLLEEKRKSLLADATILRGLNPNNPNYAALLDDVRFYNSKLEDAEHFRFLGDWCLNLNVTKAQLALSQYRYYHDSKN